MHGQQSVVHTFRPAFLHQGNVDQGLSIYLRCLTRPLSDNQHVKPYHRILQSSIPQPFTSEQE
jgi:hypothetical protein